VGGHYRTENHARYWLTPWKHNEDSAGRFARHAVRQLAAEGCPVILFYDSTTHPPLRWVERDVPSLRLVGEGENHQLRRMLEKNPQAFRDMVRRTQHKGIRLSRM